MTEQVREFMLNKRIKAAVCILSSIIAVLILLVPVLESSEQDAVTVFSDAYTDRTVIIDAGHGGADGGAVSLSGVYESDLNLDISLRLEQVFAFMGIRTKMTRDTANIDYPPEAETIRAKKVYDQKTRVELINSIPNAVLISIHQNKYTSSSPSGAQILYNTNDGSDVLSVSIQDSLITANCNVRPMAQISSDVYLMKNITCPAVLIECGFLSNPNDEALLLTEEYQLKLACGIVSGYTIYNGGTNEG